MTRDPLHPGADPELKYARGQSARPPGQRPLAALEWTALAHAAIFVIWTTWGFGGAAETMRVAFTYWGALGVLITLTALQDSDRRRAEWLRPLRWLWPFGAFNLFVVVGALNPSFREVNFAGETLLAHAGAHSAIPSSARPVLAIRALLLFDALWITGFNLAFIVRQRRALRGLLLLALVNAALLAVFGTAQKLAGANGIYFGQVAVKQTYFFATFVYHNHWGAFMLLMMSACLGLIWHYARRHDARNFFHSPAFGGLVALFLLAATVPLSGSRSCTLATLALFVGAFAHWAIRMVRQRRARRESAAPPILAAVVALAIGAAGIWFVARDTITARSVLTQQQVGTMLHQGSIGARADLYRNTWTMAKDKLWFGWGMGSYPHVFSRFYNTQASRTDRLPVFYRDAHSDWLQALAEYGLIGCTLLGLCAVLPLRELRLKHLRSPMPLYLLGGCGIVLLYAGIEFPFGNVSVVLTWWICLFSAVQYGRLQDRETTGPMRA